MKLLFRLFLLAAMVALGWWLWTVCFPSPEKVVLQRMQSLAQVLTFKSDISNINRATRASEFIGYFSVDTEILIDVPELGTHTMSGRDEVREAGNGGFAALTSYGWTAVEIVVRDVERLAAQLADSPFRIIGPPAVLEFDFTDQLKAMQVVGPGGEVIYLTQIDGVIPGFDLPVAHSFVGQPFIMVLASPDIATAGAFYAGFGRPVGPTMAAPIAILSHAHDLAPDYRHNLATVALDDASLIEIDASPAGTVARPLSSIGLPCGVAMVSLHGAVPAAKPDGSRLAKGNAGEWVEIVA